MNAQTITVTLGEREFEVERLRIRADAAWREKARPIIDPVAELVMASRLENPTPKQMVRLAFTSNLFVEPMAVLECVLDYSPALQAEREWIEANAYAEEALAALLALFFGVMGASRPPGAAQKQPETTSTS